MQERSLCSSAVLSDLGRKEFFLAGYIFSLMQIFIASPYLINIDFILCISMSG